MEPPQGPGTWCVASPWEAQWPEAYPEAAERATGMGPSTAGRWTSRRGRGASASLPPPKALGRMAAAGRGGDMIVLGRRERGAPPDPVHKPCLFSKGDSSHSQPLRPETLLSHSGGLRHVGGVRRSGVCGGRGPATAQ